MNAPAIRISYRVDTQADHLDGCPFPWEPSPIAWADVEMALAEAKQTREDHAASGAGHRLDVRVVKVKEETVRAFRDPAFREQWTKEVSL
jgi:hypothetical protein